MVALVAQRHPDELVARIKAGAQFMSLKMVARLVNVPVDTCEAYVYGRMRPHIEPDREVIEALTQILQGKAA